MSDSHGHAGSAAGNSSTGILSVGAIVLFIATSLVVVLAYGYMPKKTDTAASPPSQAAERPQEARFTPASLPTRMSAAPLPGTPADSGCAAFEIDVSHNCHAKHGEGTGVINFSQTKPLAGYHFCWKKFDGTVTPILADGTPGKFEGKPLENLNGYTFDPDHDQDITYWFGKDCDAAAPPSATAEQTAKPSDAKQI